MTPKYIIEYKYPDDAKNNQSTATTYAELINMKRELEYVCDWICIKKIIDGKAVKIKRKN